MNKTIIVSNRLPVHLKISKDTVQVNRSVGGLATGMRSVHQEGNGLWIGWSGLTQEEQSRSLEGKVSAALKAEKCVAVPLQASDIEFYYHGFSNSGLWPLFHYFQAYTAFEKSHWEAYRNVNMKFAEVVLKQAEDGDTIWVHDYQLMLLPELLKEQNPSLTIGFFLHIPFPSYEIFRICPWRDALLKGLLGADLIGFHTYDYVRHFLSSASRITDVDIRFNVLHYKAREIRVDCFPMGIDYNRFHQAALEHQSLPAGERSELLQSLQTNLSTGKLILSIDRMDYTKGIQARIRSFEHFLLKYPQYKEKVRLLMLAVPSREEVAQYQELKKETDELVGRVNGRFATVNWTPIWYFYRSMPFNDLIDLYAWADVALVTPIRDGMNLVAKEYIACRVNNDGVLVLSEMAGAAKELSDALLVNPFNYDELATTLKQAMDMPPCEQSDRMQRMQRRVKCYNVEHWASEFLKALSITRQNVAVHTPALGKATTGAIIARLNKAKKTLILLDYDGTLMGFRNNPSDARPDQQLLELLDQIHTGSTEVVIISGRDRKTLEQWFGQKCYTVITDHGVWMYRKGSWEAIETPMTDWKEHLRPILESFADSTPGSFVEEKEYSLAWHYRMADPELGIIRKNELKAALNAFTTNDMLGVLEGKKVLEIKSSAINKGRAASLLTQQQAYDFIIAIGDDWTDEYMFEQLPDSACTIKVGAGKTAASLFVDTIEEVRPFLLKIAGEISKMTKNTV